MHCWKGRPGINVMCVEKGREFFLFFAFQKREAREPEKRKRKLLIFLLLLLTGQLGQDRRLPDGLLPLEAERRLRGVEGPEGGAVGVEGGVVVVDKGLCF